MKKIFTLNWFFCLSLIVFFSSCVDQKQVLYFQKNANSRDTINVAKAYVPKIQTGDILSISVGSLNPAASSFFNPFSSAPADGASDASTPGGSPGGSTGTTNNIGFLVDSAGMIEIPLVGLIKMAGLNTTQAREEIKSRLKKYLKEPTVNVRLLNYKVSVLGEVARPAMYVIPNEKVTLPEVLTMAGDLTIYGKRDNILIVRDNNGQKEFGRINLNSRDLFTSPYYYLHSGDLVYIEPIKAKAAQTSSAFRVLPLVFSATSLLVTLYFAIKK